ncbi:MAG: NAD(P)H-binding protein [Bacteroidota bacterium]
MSTILITGATGNIGFEVIHYLFKNKTSHRIIVGVRDVEKAHQVLANYAKLEFVYFDFEDSSTFDRALVDIDRVFLVRPPHISDVSTYFKPLLSACVKNNSNEIVFISVQGAEKNTIIPHNKIERLIQEYGLDYVFLRPSYFMQNLTTTLMHDISTKRKIILPAGQAKFNWVDIENIAEIAAVMLNKFSEYSGQAYDITGLENENFNTVTAFINSIITKPISYRNCNLFLFFWIKKREGMKTEMIIVMMLLHFLPRFRHEPGLSDVYERVTGKKPTDLRTFIEREKTKFELEC